MHTSAPAVSGPKLLKARMRHTRLFILALFPLTLLSHGVIGADTALEEFLDMAGLLLVVTCILGRVFCTAFIGGRKNDEVVDIGPFSVVRNPLYCFSFLGVIGIGMQSTSLVIFCILVGGFMLYYPSVVRREEAFLRHKFGPAYDDYCARVPRWIPRFLQWKTTEVVELKPKFLLNSMLDGVVFLLPFMFFELLEQLRETGMISPLFQLP